MIAQFFYVAAQVGIAALFINYCTEVGAGMNNSKAAYLLSKLFTSNKCKMNNIKREPKRPGEVLIPSKRLKLRKMISKPSTSLNSTNSNLDLSYNHKSSEILEAVKAIAAAQSEQQVGMLVDQRGADDAADRRQHVENPTRDRSPRQQRFIQRGPVGLFARLGAHLLEAYAATYT